MVTYWSLQESLLATLDKTRQLKEIKPLLKKKKKVSMVLFLLFKEVCIARFTFSIAKEAVYQRTCWHIMVLRGSGMRV